MKTAHKSLAETVAGVAAADVDEAWERLGQPTVSPPGFDPAMTEPLPEPARRWLTHVIAPGTPVARAVIVEMRGHIRLGRWIPFRAVQVQAPPAGFIWAARVRWGPVWIGGYDRYGDALGEMRWRLFGRIPVLSAPRASSSERRSPGLSSSKHWTSSTPAIIAGAPGYRVCRKLGGSPVSSRVWRSA